MVVEPVVHIAGLLGILEVPVGDSQGHILEAHVPNEAQVGPNGNEIAEEDGVVVDSNAIIEPLTMVVETVNALIADVTVAAVLGSENLTCGT